MIKISSSKADVPRARKGVWDCPYCDYKNNDTISGKGWMTKKQIREIVLDSFGKADRYIIVISECPVCFKLSWIHNYIDDMWMEQILTKKENAILNEEYEKRCMQMKKDWDESACKICKHRKSINFDYLYPHIGCQHPHGTASGTAKKECVHYKKLKKRRKKK